MATTLLLRKLLELRSKIPKVERPAKGGALEIPQEEPNGTHRLNSRAWAPSPRSATSLRCCTAEPRNSNSGRSKSPEDGFDFRCIPFGRRMLAPHHWPSELCMGLGRGQQAGETLFPCSCCTDVVVQINSIHPSTFEQGAVPGSVHPVPRRNRGQTANA